MSDQDLEVRLYGPQGWKPGRRKRPEPDWSVVHREMKRKHVTLQVLWPGNVQSIALMWWINLPARSPAACHPWSQKS